MATLSAVAAAVSGSLEVSEVFEALQGVLSQRMGIPGGAIFSYDQGEDRLSLEVGWGLSQAALAQLENLPAASYHDDRVIHGKEPILELDLPKTGPFAGLAACEPPWRGHLAIPLVAEGEIQGVADLFTRSPAGFGQEQVAFFAALGQQVGIALENARLFCQVRAGRERLRQLSQRLMKVQEAERRHIARELHDQIGQELTALKLVLATGARGQTGTQPAYLEEAMTLLDELMIRVRDLSLDLRPSILDDLGLLPALLWHFERYTAQTGVRVKLGHSGLERRFHSATETAAYRIIQEALTNVARHAEVAEVTVRVWVEEDRLGVQIEDQGKGFDPGAALASGASGGLRGMRERAGLMGGRLEIESSPGAGTRLIAELPLGAWIERRGTER